MQSPRLRFGVRVTVAAVFFPVFGEMSQPVANFAVRFSFCVSLRLVFLFFRTPSFRLTVRIDQIILLYDDRMLILSAGSRYDSEMREMYEREAAEASPGCGYDSKRGTKMQDNKQKLLDAVKIAVSKYGVDGASTRKIAEEAGVYDVYIYRYFECREALLLEAYELESAPVIDEAVRRIRSLTNNRLGIHLRESAAIVFKGVWEKLTKNPELCIFFNYYYHSHLFEESAAEFHSAQVDKLVSALSWLFDTESEARTVIYALFTLIFDYAQQTVSGRLPNTEETAGSVFSLLYMILYNRSIRGKSPEGKI